MFPRAFPRFRTRRSHVFFSTAVVLALVTGFLPFSPLTPAFAANPAADLDQCANGGVAEPDEQCQGSNWVNGNLGGSKAHYLEGQSVPYRMKFTDLATAGTHTVVIEWDTTKGGKHALDYLTTFNRTETDALPCSGVADCDPSVSSTFPIPADTVMTGRADWGGSAVQVPGVFTLFGGTISGVLPAYAFNGSWDADSSTSIAITFTASVPNPVLAWGGHIASRSDWGMANSAVSISGSPYHMRLLALDGAGGNQDRSLSNDAVIFPGSITVVKQAAPDGPAPFGFTATGGFLPPSFSLIDDGSVSNTRTVTGITTFTTSTVTEAATPGWTLTSLICTDPTGGTSTSGRTATIGMVEGDNVVCTFNNTRNASITVVKTAAPESVPEPGGPVTFHLSITNDSSVSAVTITSLSDDVYGNVAAIQGTNCALPQTIVAGGTWSCSFQGNVTGDAGSTHTDVVTASGTDALGNPVSDTDDATVTVTNVNPTVAVDKAASPSSVPEPGAAVTFLVTVSNPANAVEKIFVHSLVDNIYGNLDGKGTCVVSPPVELAPGGSYSCSFTETVSGDAGSTHVDIVTGTARDNENNNVSDTGTATVTITDVVPQIVVDKSAEPSTVAEPGGLVTFTVTVTNPQSAVETISLASLIDDVYGNLDGVGTCDVTPPVSLAPGARYSCSFSKSVSGDSGSVHIDVITGTAFDNEENEVTDTGTATVTVIDVAPIISIDKAAGATTVLVGEQVTYTYRVTNPGVEPLVGVGVTDDRCAPVTRTGGDSDGDDQLDVDEAWVYSCTTALLGTTVNTGTATGHDNEGNTVTATDTAQVVVRILHPAITIDKTVDPPSVSGSGTVTYTYVITNTGDTTLFNVLVTDDILGPIGSVGELVPGASLTMAKTVDVDVATPPTNIGTVVGTDVLGATVTASDSATITVVLPQVLAQPELPRTGAPLGAQTRAALAMIQVGIVLTLAGRRRRVIRRAD